MDIAPYAGAIVTAIVAVVGAYVTMKNAWNEKLSALSIQIATLDTKLDGMMKQVEKHNSVLERTASLERDMKTAFARIGENRVEIDKLESKLG